MLVHVAFLMGARQTPRPEPGTVGDSKCTEIKKEPFMLPRSVSPSGTHSGWDALRVGRPGRASRETRGKRASRPPPTQPAGSAASRGGAPRPPPPRASTGRSLRRRPAPGSCALASPAPHAVLRNAGRALAWGPLAHGEVAEQDPRSSRLSLGPWLPRPCGGLSPAALRNSGDAFEALLRKGCVPEEQSEPPSLRSSRVPI